MKHIITKTPGSLRKSLCLESDFNVKPMPYIYIALCSLQVGVSGSPFYLPSGLCGVIVDYRYSFWWKKKTNSEKWGTWWYSQDLNLYLPLNLPWAVAVRTQPFDLECACHSAEMGTRGGFCKVIHLKSEEASFPWAQSLRHGLIGFCPSCSDLLTVSMGLT